MLGPGCFPETKRHFDSAWLGSRWLEAYHRAAIEGVVYAVFGARLGVDNYAVEIVRPTKLPGLVHNKLSPGKT